MAILLTLRALLERCEMLRTTTNRNTHDENLETNLIHFLSEICDVCAGFRRIVVRTLLCTENTNRIAPISFLRTSTNSSTFSSLSSSTTKPCVLRKLLVCLVVFKEKATDAFAMLYLKLLLDFEFKKRFTYCFVTAHSHLMLKMLNAVQGIGYTQKESESMNRFMDRIFVRWKEMEILFLHYIHLPTHKHAHSAFARRYNSLQILNEFWNLRKHIDCRFEY